MTCTESAFDDGDDVSVPLLRRLVRRFDVSVTEKLALAGRGERTRPHPPLAPLALPRRFLPGRRCPRMLDTLEHPSQSRYACVLGDVD